VRVIIWLNGGFGAGKTTLTPAELADEVLARDRAMRMHF
jgi:hypothetical protein